MSITTLATLAASKTRGVLPIGTDGNAYCITSYTGNGADASINCLVSETGIFLTEENTPSELIKSVFEEGSEQEGIYFSNDDVECIFNEEPSLLVQLYMLFDDSNCDKDKLMSVITKLIKEGEYHPEKVLLNLLNLSRGELTDFVESEDIISKFQELIT